MRLAPSPHSLQVKGDEIGARPYHALMTRVLLTGFGPFPGAPENPTAQIVETLAKQRFEGVELVTCILPVIWREAETRISALIHEVRPDVILHLGLATKRMTIGVETRARNETTRITPDAENIRRTSGTIDAKGPGLRQVRMDCARVVKTLHAASLEAEISDDAGDYICNHTLYLSLGTDVPRVGFIHLPMPDARMSLAAMTQGIANVVKMLAKEA